MWIGYMSNMSTPFYIWNLSILGFWNPRGGTETIPPQRVRDSYNRGLQYFRALFLNVLT
jgi:hypothetical protein